MVTTPGLPELKERLDDAFKHRMGLLGCPVQSQESDRMILEGPFPPSALNPSRCRHVPSPRPRPERGWAELAQPEVIRTCHFLSPGCGVAFWLYLTVRAGISHPASRAVPVRSCPVLSLRSQR